jgi:AraC family transcriptional regulator
MPLRNMGLPGCRRRQPIGGWSGLSAELRSHRDGVIAWKNLRPDTEICVDVFGNGSIITRQGAGIIDRTVAEIRW